MAGKRRNQTIRWLLSVILVAAGLTVTWAWGEVARLAPPPPTATAAEPAAVYAAWQPEDAAHSQLYRSNDEGATWQPLDLPGEASPAVWAGDGGSRLVVATDDGLLLRSEDRGDSWSGEPASLSALSLAWDHGGNLYAGTEDQGVYRWAAEGAPLRLDGPETDPVASPIVALSWTGGRLYAATPGTLFYTDAGADGRTATNWVRSQAVADGIRSLAITDQGIVYVGTAISGVIRSNDAGQTWTPAWEGLGLAAGQMVAVNTLLVDPLEPGVLYAAVDHLVGSTKVHASAAGIYASLDSGRTWQPLAGPAFPEARHALALVVVAGRPLYAQAVTVDGLQSYAPDVVGAMAALQSGDSRQRAAAARLLGLARATDAGSALLAALDDADPGVALAASNALGRIGDPDTAVGLLVALDHPREQVRLGAARALGLIGAEAAVEPLGTMLLHGEGLAVSVAAEALGRIGSPAAIDALLVPLADPVQTARQHAALAALEATGEPAAGPLAEMLAGRDTHSRRSAALALGWVGSPGATSSLAGALQDEDAVVRRQAAWALGQIGDPAARAALERAQVDDVEAGVRAEAAQALSRLAEEQAAGGGRTLSWASVLNRLQAARWLILALSLAGAAWLVVGSPSLAGLRLASERQRPQAQ